MKRLLTCTAVGLFLGLTPAVAATDMPADDSQMPSATQQDAAPAAPAQPSEAMPIEPSDPAEPIPGQSSEASPSPGAAQSSEAPLEPAPLEQSSEAPGDPQSLSPSAEAPAASDESLSPSAELSVDSPQFLAKQNSNDWLASEFIGEEVKNAEDERIGSIKDLITDEQGKVVAVLLSTGGFLGIGEKEVAVRFEDLKLTRDEDNDVTAMINSNQDTLASAPDYETLSEQRVTVGGDGVGLDQDAPSSSN